MEFVPLHESPEFQKDCAEVLNEEWKRSLTARLHSLEKSRDSFPVCLILLGNGEDGKQHVIGHSMLSVVRGQSVPSCLVESVVVRKSLRGKGYGRIVMQKTEEFAAGKGYKVMYLTTHDKQKFYEHLGYEYCSPVVTFGSDILPEQLANKLMGSLAIKTQGDEKSTEKLKINPINSETKCTGDSRPLGTNSEKNTTKLDKSSNAQHDVSSTNSQPPQPLAPPSSATLAPPPPMAPPPPVAPPKIPDKSGDKAVTRWDPAHVSWMKKTIV